MSTQRANYLYPSIGMGLILASIIFVVVLVPRWTFKPAEPRDLRDYTAQERRGREIYKREGCWYCHSMVSRPQDWDHGVRSKSSDYYFDEYHLVGSERSGPDLANIGGKFPDEYHIQHHREPRSLKPGSNMPRFDYLSEQEMVDLTAYLQSLGPNGTRALDPTLERGAKRSVGQELYAKSGETRWAKVADWTWEQGPLKGQTEKVAKWKGDVIDREALAARNYDAHPEVPYKYSAEIQELLYGTSHEAQNSKTPLKACITPAFANEELLAEARVENPNLPGWSEVDFKEPAVTPTDVVEAKALAYRRTLSNQGRGIFNQKCAACHGLDGNGRGWAAASMTKRPANFQEDKYSSYTTEAWFWRISRGVPATQMPRWEYTLDPYQRLQLTAFLKYISHNQGLGVLLGVEGEYGKPPSAAATAAAAQAPAASAAKK
jgi:cbb3-type cytochrome oxidase cytochrome c subunit